MSRFDQKLTAGEGVVGTFSHLGGPAVAECLSLSGLDYVIIDTEHGPFLDESTGEMIRAIELHSAEAFVRVRDSSRAAVLHALDLGARGIIIPDVQARCPKSITLLTDSGTYRFSPGVTASSTGSVSTAPG